MGSSVDKRLSAADPSLRAQVLNLDRWLIPQQNPEIPRFTFNNFVEPLIDGQTAMREMHAAFTATAADGYIYITDWDIVPEIHLLGRTTPASQLDAVLGAARTRGMDVRILLWYGNPAVGAGAIVRNDIDAWERFSWATIFVDNKTRGAGGAHHQKTSAVRTGNELVSFVGGIDLTTNRWDTTKHLFPDSNADYEPGDEKPWHDVHARVRGPASADIETNFRQRWNDRHSDPSAQVPRHAVPGPLPDHQHIVQTLRTFPHHATILGTPVWHYDFAPAGEFGLRQAYLRAIGNARNYIFIEDQYMVSDQISAHIAAAMRRSSDLKVILVTAPQPDAQVAAFDFHQNAFVNRLRDVDPHRVGIYHLVNGSGTLNRTGVPGGIYCHAKVCLVDDIWAIIGSCNMSLRSLTHDSEISIAVVDETIEHGRRKFARDLRIALWTEHLGLIPDERPLIDDPIAGAAEWSKRAGTPLAQARAHVRPAGTEHPDIWSTFVDPDGSAP